MADQIKYTGKLKDARILIVGGSSGIGFAAAEASVEEGAHVIISSSQQKRVEDAVKRLQQAYPSASAKVSGYVCNLSDENTLEQNVQDLFSKVGGKLDHIVHTAGDALAIIPLKEASLSQIKQAGMVRFFAALIVAKVGYQYLKPGPQASIVLTAGAAGERPMPDWTIVSGYLAGMQGMMRNLALDLAPVRVNLISPGPVHTELWNSVPSEQRHPLFKTVAAATTTGQVAEAADVAEAYLYCMKDRNLTGSMISTNGGSLLKR